MRMTRLSAFGSLALAGVSLALLVPGDVGAQVRFERTGFRLTSIGERIAVSGRVLDSRRRPVPSTQIRWRISDPTVASVSREGVVVSRKAGNTRLWAVAGEDSASALIVVDQWAAKFEFVPALVRLDAVGAKAPVRIQVKDAEGHAISEQNRKPTSCRSTNERVATLSATGEVTARANGVTYIRCADRGIADSARIEVRQRPARVVIADKTSFATKAVGDVFTLRLTATDRANDEIREPQATWASLNPSIVSIDPITGAARTVGAGTARIVAQVGDVTDTLSVGVAAIAGGTVPQNADTTATVDVTSVRTPTLNIDGLFPIVGEQTTVRFAARDAAGNDVPNAAVTLRSSDTTIFVVLPNYKIQAKSAGPAWVFGRFGNVIDSAQVNVRPLTNAAAGGGAAEAKTAAFRRPNINVDSLTRIHARSRAAADSELIASQVGRAASGRYIQLNAVGGQSAYTFSDSTGVEKRAGITFGGAAELAPLKWFRLGGEFRTGTLAPSGGMVLGNDITLTQVGADVTLQPWPALGVRVGYTLRGMREGGADSATFLSRQLWQIPRVTLLTRLSFVGGRVFTVAGATLIPYAKYPIGTPNDLNYGGEAGIEAQFRFANINLLYSVEHFGFLPVGSQAPRVDQFSSIRLRIGLQRGR